MTHTVYLETSIISYLTARPSRDLVTAARQELTREWWELRRAAFDIYVSAAVIAEVRAGDSEAATRRLSVLADLELNPYRQCRTAADHRACVSRPQVHAAYSVHARRTTGRLKWHDRYERNMLDGRTRSSRRSARCGRSSLGQPVTTSTSSVVSCASSNRKRGARSSLAHRANLGGERLGAQPLQGRTSAHGRPYKREI